MPKMKSHSGAQKRFRVRKNAKKGSKVKCRSSNRGHNFGTESRSTKRRRRAPGKQLCAADQKTILTVLNGG
jgi:ribosomal protein L35